MMTFNHLKISYRNLAKNKIYTFINILGLSVGIASMILIGLYVRFETSYDKFFEDSDRIHRVALHRIYPGRVKDFGTSSTQLATVLNRNYPEVEMATRLHRLFFQNEIPIRVEETDRSFIEDKYLFADSLFFQVFSHKFIQGTPETALVDNGGIVITRSTAIKYFGTDQALGKTVTSGQNSLAVTGVIEDIPANSHIHFNLLGTTTSLGFLNNAISNDNWTSPWVYTYVKLKENADAVAFGEQLGPLVDTYGNADISSSLGVDWKEKGHAFNYFLQPLTAIHLRSQLDVEVEPNSNISYVYVLVAIAVFILLISGINFINLSIARSTERAKEVGIRKVMGSNRRALVGQFLTESVFVASLSAVLGIGFLYFFIPVFNNLLGTHLSFADLANLPTVLLVIAFVAITGIVAGLYPAFVISALQPSRVLKGAFRSSSKGQLLRNALIVFQFLISVVMISGSIIADQQMSYLQNKDLGFNKESLMVIRTGSLGQDYGAFKNSLSAMPGVRQIGGSNMLPGDFHGSNVFDINDPNVEDLRVNTCSVDDDFIETIGYELVAGRDFAREFQDSLSIILNEAAVKAMGVENALGLKFKATTNAGGNAVPEFSVVGVVRDFNFYSLHSEVGPMVIFNNGPQSLAAQTILRFDPVALSGLLKELGSTWEQYSEQPLNYSFLSDNLARQYQADQNTAFMFDIFTYIAIILSCTGLFGLATYIVNQRSKEMSVRKVLGASIANIIGVFSRDFALLILMAFLAGVPIAYYALNQWLNNFAYHSEIGVLSFVIAALVTVLLVAVTVGYQAIKVALVDPAKILRSE